MKAQILQAAREAEWNDHQLSVVLLELLEDIDHGITLSDPIVLEAWLQRAKERHPKTQVLTVPVNVTPQQLHAALHGDPKSIFADKEPECVNIAPPWLPSK